MPHTPEPVYETVTPAELSERLEMVRERFRTGVINAESFNVVMKQFQFRDTLGHLWSPGATTGKWYRWDGHRWIPDSPPSTLNVPQAPVMVDDFDEHEARSRWRPPPASPAAVCPTCGTPNTGKKFCTKCGTRLAQS